MNLMWICKFIIRILTCHIVTTKKLNIATDFTLKMFLLMICICVMIIFILEKTNSVSLMQKYYISDVFFYSSTLRILDFTAFSYIFIKSQSTY